MRWRLIIAVALRQAAMHGQLHQAHRRPTAKPGAPADDVHRPQPSAQKLVARPQSV